MYFVLIILLGISLIVSLVLYALRQNINLYFTPTQLLSQHIAPTLRVRIGGMVREGSIQRNSMIDPLAVHFVVTDLEHDIDVQYSGVLPDLFREGQGVVALGTLGSDRVFIAQQILAKHDENYMPPGSANAA